MGSDYEKTGMFLGDVDAGTALLLAITAVMIGGLNCWIVIASSEPGRYVWIGCRSSCREAACSSHRGVPSSSQLVDRSRDGAVCVEIRRFGIASTMRLHPIRFKLGVGDSSGVANEVHPTIDRAGSDARNSVMLGPDLRVDQSRGTGLSTAPKDAPRLIAHLFLFVFCCTEVRLRLTESVLHSSQCKTRASQTKGYKSNGTRGDKA